MFRPVSAGKKAALIVACVSMAASLVFSGAARAADMIKVLIDDLRATAERAQRAGDFEQASRILYAEIPTFEEELERVTAEVNEQDGVLILSETAGAWEQLGADALQIAATDPCETCASRSWTAATSVAFIACRRKSSTRTMRIWIVQRC